MKTQKDIGLIVNLVRHMGYIVRRRGAGLYIMNMRAREEEGAREHIRMLIEFESDALEWLDIEAFDSRAAQHRAGYKV